MADGSGNEVTPSAALAEAAGTPEDIETRIVLLTRKPGSTFSGYALNPTAQLQGDFRRAAQGFANELLEKRTLVQYSPGRKPDEYELVWVRVDEVPELAPIITAAGGDAPLELFDVHSGEAKHLRLLVVALRRVHPGNILFIQETSIRAQLSRSHKLAAVLSGAAYDKLTSDVLLFAASFDAIVVNDLVLMANQRAFERAVGFLDQAGPAAQQTFAAISSKLRIKNAPDLVTAIQSDPNMIAKLRGIQEKMTQNAAYQAAMTMTNIVPFIENRPELGIELEGTKGKEALVFRSDPRHRWHILKLLDDDYDLISQLTKTHYEANSKSVLP